MKVEVWTGKSLPRRGLSAGLRRVPMSRETRKVCCLSSTEVSSQEGKYEAETRQKRINSSPDCEHLQKDVPANQCRRSRLFPFVSQRDIKWKLVPRIVGRRPPTCSSSSLQTGRECFNHLRWIDSNGIQRTSCTHRIKSHYSTAEVRRLHNVWKETIKSLHAAKINTEFQQN